MTSWQAKGSKLTSRCFRCSRQVSSFSSPRTVSCWKSIISMATVWSPPQCDRHGSFPRWAPRPLPYCEVKGRWWQMGTLKTCKKWLDVNDFQVNWGHHTVNTYESWLKTWLSWLFLHLSGDGTVVCWGDPSAVDTRAVSWLPKVICSVTVYTAFDLGVFLKLSNGKQVWKWFGKSFKFLSSLGFAGWWNGVVIDSVTVT